MSLLRVLELKYNVKVILSNKIYLKPDEELKARLQKQLTYEIIDPQAKYPRYHQMFGVVAKDVYWMPNTRLDLLADCDLEIKDKRISVPCEVPKPSFILRDDQAAIVDEVDGDCIVNGAPGFGKTITALALAYKLQEKTLVVCTNVNIRQMWEQEIEKFFGFKPSVIGSGRCETDAPITVANIQTVRKHGHALATTFGMLVIDEAHHCVAATFNDVVMFSHAKYKIGLTGTLKRKDGLHACFPNYFGLKIFKPKERNTLPPTIHRYSLDCGLPGTQQTPWAIRINELYEYPEYHGTIKELANSYALLGHKVLVVNDRINLLESLSRENAVPSYLITGSTKSTGKIAEDGSITEMERLEILDAVAKEPGPCILYATQSIFAEGISLNELSCVILGTPTNNESLVQQIIGRVQRIAEGKLSPIAVDLALGCGTGARHASMRRAVYFSRGWPLEDWTKARLASELNKIALAN